MALPSSARFQPSSRGSGQIVLFAVLTIAAAILAHGGCLHAIFYLDDWWQIVDSDSIETGKWWSAGSSALTYLTYWFTWRIAGYSPLAFHAGNLLLHMVLALCVLTLSQVFWTESGQFNDRDGRFVAGFGALIFAVHPLTSEITHYARARDHEIVALFSFLTAVCAALWIRRGWRWFPALGACVLASALSKGPGIWHAMLSIAIVLACVSRVIDWRTRFPNRWWIYGSILAVEGGLALVREHVVEVLLLPVNQLHDWRFGWHLLTQSRVFWSYVWRMIVPVRLCCDHLIAWTRSLSDLSAWLGVAGILLWVVVTIWLWLRRRRFEALLSAMILAPLLLRFGYVVSELMVEYRTYPAMPWLGLLIARCVIPWRTRVPRLVTAGTTAYLVLLVALTNMRSRDWRSTTAISANILSQYPLQLRAYNGMSSADLREGNYHAVLERSPEFFRKMEQLMAFDRRDSARYYDIWPVCVVSEECNIADALLETKGPSAARKSLEGAAGRMRVSGVKNDDLWALWYFSMGKVELRAGNRFAAERNFRQIDPLYISRRTIDKERTKGGVQ